MTSNRPYLLRAMNDWIIDNDMTPYIIVNAEFPGTTVPQEFIQDGKIILNISPAAVKSLIIDNEVLTCGARFAGRFMDVICPVEAISAIYASENRNGMMFSKEDREGGLGVKNEPIYKKPELKIVK